MFKEHLPLFGCWQMDWHSMSKLATSWSEKLGRIKRIHKKTGEILNTAHNNKTKGSQCITQFTKQQTKSMANFT